MLSVHWKVENGTGYAAIPYCPLNRITFSAYASLGCRCLAAFDRYACTSRLTTVRQWSSLATVHRLLVANVLLWAMFALPHLLFIDLIRVSPTEVICFTPHRIYSNYFAYFVNPVLYFALPVIILNTLAIKTRRHLQLMARSRQIQRIERQMTSVGKFQQDTVISHFVI